MTFDAVSLNAAPASATRERLANRLHSFHRRLCLQTGVQSKPVDYFISSVTALLAAFAAALFLCNIAHAELVAPRDPLFALRTSALFWILGMEAMAVALACVYVRPSRFKLVLVLWFAATLVIYRLGLQWQGVHNLWGYTGSLAHTFGLSNGLAIILLNLLFAYLFTGSAALLLWDCLARPEEVQLKATCIHCGGHIAFSSGHLGQKIVCPHCSKETTLHKPGILKMSCFFCQQHIEFPPHAIGTKIPCPHCKMDITLKEPV
jgi:DNA-directed RNA polymerase subunit RPC12/RpoP